MRRAPAPGWLKVAWIGAKALSKCIRTNTVSELGGLATTRRNRVQLVNRLPCRMLAFCSTETATYECSARMREVLHQSLSVSPLADGARPCRSSRLHWPALFKILESS